MLECIWAFFKLIWFKLGRAIAATVLYILVVVWVTLITVQGCRGARKNKLSCYLFHKVLSRFRWSLVCCWDLFVFLMNLILIVAYDLHMDVCNQYVFVGRAGLLSIHTVLHAQNFIAGHYLQPFQPNLIMPVMLLIPLTFTLQCHIQWPFDFLAEGHRVSRKQNLLASFSHTLFNWSGWNRYCVEAVQVENPSWYLFWVRVIQVKCL